MCTDVQRYDRRVNHPDIGSIIDFKPRINDTYNAMSASANAQSEMDVPPRLLFIIAAVPIG
jgi:hypothetical protein